jgi:hypothetical protein
MQNRWLVVVPALAVAAPAAAQDPDVEAALLGCKHAAIEEVVRDGGRAVLTVRFPPGARVWLARQKGSRVEGPGEYRTGPDEWHGFRYVCVFDHTTATTRIKVQRGGDVEGDGASSPAGESPQPAPRAQSRPVERRRR